MWAVEARGEKGQLKHLLLALGVNGEGMRHVEWEREPETLWRITGVNQYGTRADRNLSILRNTLEPMLRRELEHRGLEVNRGFEAKLVAG